MVNDAGSCGDQLQMVFALKPLLDYVHVQEAKKPAAVAEAEGNGGLRFEDESRVV